MSRMNDPMQSGERSADQLRDTAANVTQGIRDLGSQARDAATEKYDELRQQATEYYDQGRQRAQEWERGLEDYVQQKPVQSLLIAAGVGMLLGVLWKR
jgi:ElaB/YqjD/DUF883 family membrane-anchored ribosome-binding protein